MEGRYNSPQSASSMRSVTGSGSSAPSSGRNITLNIWDFAGQAAYYTTHQVSRPNLKDIDQLLCNPVRRHTSKNSLEHDI